MEFKRVNNWEQLQPIIINNNCCQWFCYTCAYVRSLVFWGRAYLSVGQEEETFCVEHLAVPTPLYFPLLISMTGACLLGSMGGSWLGSQVLPAIGAVSILELATNSGSSRTSQAPNCHFNSNAAVNKINNYVCMYLPLAFEQKCPHSNLVLSLFQGDSFPQLLHLLVFENKISL